MEVMEIAATLGKAIKEHEVYKKFLAAKEAYDNNDAINRKIMEYGVQQKALANEAGKAEHDDHSAENGGYCRFGRERYT